MYGCEGENYVKVTNLVLVFLGPPWNTLFVDYLILSQIKCPYFLHQPNTNSWIILFSSPNDSKFDLKIFIKQVQFVWAKHIF